MCLNPFGSFRAAMDIAVDASVFPKKQDLEMTLTENLNQSKRLFFFTEPAFK